MKEFLQKCRNHRILILLISLVILGLVLRFTNFWDHMLFAYDQARDAQRIMGMISLKHLKIVGPETDIPGVFNGPLFYYLLTPLYALFRLNPNGAALGIALINVLSILIVYYTGKVLFTNKYVGILGAFFWTVSFEQIAYSRYISNASLMGVSAAVFFLGCAMFFVRKKDIGLPISALGLGLCINFNFYLIYLVIFYLIFFFIYRTKCTVKSLGISIGILLLLLLPLLLAEVQFHFATTKALLGYIFHQGTGNHTLKTLFDDISKYYERISTAITYSYFSFNQLVAFCIYLLFLFLSYFSVKEKKALLFLYIWIFSTVPLFVFNSGVLTTNVISASLQAGLALLFAVVIWSFLEKSRWRVIGIAIVFIIFISNLILLQENNFTPNTFFVQNGMTISQEKMVMDYTYNEAHGKPFSICGLTNPLLVDTVWGYVYNWYGGQKYGYVPYWAGIKQGLQESLLPYDANHVKLRYYIQEPLIGILPTNARLMIFAEDHVSIKVGEKQFGGIIVQKRLLQDGPQRQLVDTQNIEPHMAQYLDSVLQKTSLFSCYNTY